MDNIKEKLLEIIKKGNKNNYYFYDKVDHEIVELNKKNLALLAEMIKNKVHPLDLTQEQLELMEQYMHIAEDINRFILVPTKYDFPEASIARDFIKSITDSKIRNVLKKELNQKGGLKFFKAKLDELGIYTDYDEYKDILYGKIITEFLEQNTDVKKSDNLLKAKELIELGLRIYDEKPWMYFDDINLIKIRYKDIDFYYSILGSCGECYGFEFAIGDEGLNFLKLEQELSQEDSDSLLPGLIKKDYSVYFDPYYNLNEDGAIFINTYLNNIDKNLVYPSFNCFNYFEMPHGIKNNEECEIFLDALEALLKFLEEFSTVAIPLNDTNKCISANIENDEVDIFEVPSLGDGYIKYETPAIPKMILESFNSKLKVSEGVGYYDIKIIPTVCEDNKLPAFPILYSETEEKILCANLCLVDNYYMTTLALKTITELKEKKIPSIIYTKNHIAYVIANTLFGKVAKIKMKEQSPIDEIFDRISKEIEDKRLFN